MITKQAPNKNNEINEKDKTNIHKFRIRKQKSNIQKGKNNI